MSKRKPAPYSMEEPIELDVMLDTETLDWVQGYMKTFPERVKKSAQRAIRRAGKGFLSDMKNAIAEKYTAPKKVFDEYGTVKTTGPYNNDLKFKIQLGEKGRAKRPPLILFKHSPAGITRGADAPSIGLTIEYMKGKRYKLPGSFIADAPVRGLNIYVRQSSRSTGKADSRDKIYKQVGMSVPQMARSNDLLDEITPNISMRFQKELKHQLTEGYKHGGKK